MIKKMIRYIKNKIFLFIYLKIKKILIKTYEIIK